MASVMTTTVGGVEVGEDVYLRVEGPVESGGEEQNGRDEYQQPVLQGKMYDLVQHDCRGLMVVGMGGNEVACGGQLDVGGAAGDYVLTALEA